mgnify:FL=1
MDTDSKKTSKTYAICAVLYEANFPLTRVEILRRAHAYLEERGVKLAPFRETSNHCYFSPRGLGNGGQISVVYRGLVRREKHLAGHAYVYKLTDAGARLINP